MTQTIALQRGIMYGPVNSRRLGKSLGINLSPIRAKLCPFDCVYCHYGATKIKTTDAAKHRRQFPTACAVTAALINALNTNGAVSYVTFSGNGEPTVHPDFPQIVAEVRPIVKKLAPDARLAILSNSAMVGEPEIRTALSELDVRIMKLDAGNERMFHIMNRPAAALALAGIVDGLSRLEGVTVQTLFGTGAYDNSTDTEVADWLACLEKIRPMEVQVYTCDRQTAEAGLTKIPVGRLKEIAAAATSKLGIPVKAYYR